MVTHPFKNTLLGRNDGETSYFVLTISLASNEQMKYFCISALIAWSGLYMSPWSGFYTSAWSGFYMSAWSGLYTSAWSGLYTSAWSGFYTTAWSGLYTSPWSGLCTNAWSGFYTNNRNVQRVLKTNSSYEKQ